VKILNNGSNGIDAVGSIIRCPSSTFSGNAGWAIVVYDGSNAQMTGSSISGAVSPALNTIGNANSLISH
jgi:hypothetical protein